jgi:hypothetical protein
MNLKQLSKIKLSQLTPENIKGFLQGNVRKFLESYPGVIDDYIYEQIQWRLGIMDINCLQNKQCPCNCEVPAKQYENRPCENNCYPPMMNKEEWEQFKTLTNITKQSIETNLYNRKDYL